MRKIWTRDGSVRSWPSTVEVAWSFRRIRVFKANVDCVIQPPSSKTARWESYSVACARLQHPRRMRLTKCRKIRRTHALTCTLKRLTKAQMSKVTVVHLSRRTTWMTRLLKTSRKGRLSIEISNWHRSRLLLKRVQLRSFKQIKRDLQSCRRNSLNPIITWSLLITLSPPRFKTWSSRTSQDRLASIWPKDKSLSISSQTSVMSRWGSLPREKTRNLSNSFF